MARACFTTGCCNVTHFIDVPSSLMLTATAPVSGAAVVFDVRARGFLDGERTRLLHAGASYGMPRRLQLVCDFALIDPVAWNRVMARWLIADLTVLDPIDDADAARIRALVTALRRFC